MSDILKFLSCVCLYHNNHIQITDEVLLCSYIYCDKVLLFSDSFNANYELLQWLISYSIQFSEKVERNSVKLFQHTVKLC